jgi:hypothetical protein
VRLWPRLAGVYLAQVKKPMDLGKETIGELRKDLAVIFINSVDLNGATHEVPAKAFRGGREILEDVFACFFRAIQLENENLHDE